MSTPFHVLAKPTGAICNLDCSYCFYLPKEELYPRSKFRMSGDVLDSYLRQAIASEPSPEVTISFQGGEPTLMGLPFFERAASRAYELLPPGKSIRFTLQTNGTLLDGSWAAFLKEHRFLVGLSLDGPKHLHDVYRVDKQGGPTFDRVFSSLRLLQKHGVDFNILTCVTAANGDHGLEVYRFLRDEAGARFIQPIPVVERVFPDRTTDRSVRPEQWGRFLIGVFDEWIARDVGQVYVLMFDWALASWLGMESPACIFRKTCGDAVALEHNGDVYSCDHFVDPKHLLGNLMETPLVELVGSKGQRKFGRDKSDTLPKYCRECPVRFACNGECPKNRFARTPDGEPGLNHLCEGYRTFFTHIDPAMRAMADLLRRGRPAAEIMGRSRGDSEPAEARSPARRPPARSP